MSKENWWDSYTYNEDETNYLIPNYKIERFKNEVKDLNSQIVKLKEIVELFKAPIKYYGDTYKDAKWDTCCSGRECGCMGMPCDPEYYIHRDFMQASYLIQQLEKEDK